MSGVQNNTIGIMPVGALGVAFYYHLTGGNLEDNGVFFLNRPDGRGSTVIQKSECLHIEYGGKHLSIPTQGRFLGGMIESSDKGELPELIIVATNPDQIDVVLRGIRPLLEWMRDEDVFDSKSPAFPYFLFVANGIYFDHIRYRYVELLERSFMEGSLPDLWPEIALQLVCRLLRGPTVMAGHRSGYWNNTVYQPGVKGNTVISGSNEAGRQRVHTLLSDRGLPVEIADQSPVSIELQKALINLICNLFGVIYSIENNNRFCPLVIGDIIVPAHHPDFIELGEHVYDIARASRAVPPDACFADVFPKMIQLLQKVRTHYPSAIQSIVLFLDSRSAIPDMTPNEEWLIVPLKELASNLNLQKALVNLHNLEKRYRNALDLLRNKACHDQGGYIE